MVGAGRRRLPAPKAGDYAPARTSGDSTAEYAEGRGGRARQEPFVYFVFFVVSSFDAALVRGLALSLPHRYG
jgi:hypothetical protein